MESFGNETQSPRPYHFGGEILKWTPDDEEFEKWLNSLPEDSTEHFEKGELWDGGKWIEPRDVK